MNNDNFKKNIILTILVIFVGLMTAGGTYAWLTNSVNVTNGVHNVGMHCFLIDYNINNVSGGQDITGTLFPSENASGGLNGRVGLKTSSSCSIIGDGTLKIHVNTANNALLTNSNSYCESRKTLESISGITTKADCDTEGGRWRSYGDPYCENPNTLARLVDYTDQSSCTTNGGVWKTGGSPLKFAVYDNASATGTPLSVGSIVSSDVGNDKVLFDGFSITSTQKYYYIYVWLDGYLIDDSVAEFQFDAYISASAVQSTLPSGYQRIQYIESSGTQHILTNVIPTNNMGVYAKLKSKNTSSDLIYFGTRPATNSRFWVGNKDNKIYLGWNTNTYDNTIINSSTLSEIKLNYLNDRKLATGNNPSLLSNIGTLNTQSYKISIFGGNDAGTVKYKSSLVLYRLKISQGNAIINDFVPCRNGSTVGMCDTVESKFYSNAGTGTFTAGPDV